MKKTHSCRRNPNKIESIIIHIKVTVTVLIYTLLYFSSSIDFIFSCLKKIRSEISAKVTSSGSSITLMCHQSLLFSYYLT